MNNVSIIIPCRNEEKFITQCLDSVLAQDFPKENLEILVADGASTDKTLTILQQYAAKYPYIKIVHNEKKFTPIGLNLAIGQAKGDIIIRMDCHAKYEKDYISKCVKHLQESGADNVGGALKTLPAANTLFAKSIARALSSPMGGGGNFRMANSSPREVDTVFGGCYKKEVFTRVGLYNENLRRSQDIELNLRLKKAGGKIMLFPNIISYYYPKATLKEFFIHNFHDGVWAVYPLKFVKMPFSLRHYIPLLFVIFLILLLLSSFSDFFSAMTLYFLLLGIISLPEAIEGKNMLYIVSMPLTFSARHIGYGLGSLWGVMKLLV